MCISSSCDCSPCVTCVYKPCWIGYRLFQTSDDGLHVHARVSRMHVLGPACSLYEITLKHPVGLFSQVFVVTGLPESTSVRVSWRKDDQRLPACEWSLIGEEAASFRTLPTPGRAESVTVAALSCDRSIENKDYEFLSVLSPGAGALPVPSIHITAHIGDQLYADALTSAVLSSNTSIPFPVQSRGPRCPVDTSCTCHSL